MVRRKENVRVREVTHAQNGKGQVFFHDWLLPEEAAHHGRVFSKVVIPAGSSIGYHQHMDVTELNPGDMNLCPDGSFHGIENAGDTDLVLIALIMNQLDG